MEQLVLTAMAAESAELLQELLAAIAKNDCLIEESRASMLGNELALLMHLSGNWNNIAKLESSFTTLQAKWPIAFKRAKPLTNTSEFLPYLLQIVANNQPLVVYEVISFLNQHGVYIDDFQSTTYAASFAGTPMLSLTARIGIPANFMLTDFREQFALLCDDLNIDGVLDPEKP